MAFATMAACRFSFSAASRTRAVVDAAAVCGQRHLCRRATFSSGVTETMSPVIAPPRRLRRLRLLQGQYSVQGNTAVQQGENAFKGRGSGGGLAEPFDHGRDSVGEYLKEASLSPWVPAPDAVARKALDLAQLRPSDVHVDLGCGDGRVNFHALDYPSGGPRRSLGVDVDDRILQEALDRRSRRHPPPSHLSFHAGDLLDPSDPVWDVVLHAQPTVWTMYFAPEALQRFRPVLEDKLRILLERRQLQQQREAGTSAADSDPDRCIVLTIGSEMPGWQSRQYEVVLGTQIHLYDWSLRSVAATGDGQGEEEASVDGYGYGDDGYDVLTGDPGVLGYDPVLANSIRGSRLERTLLSERFQGAKLIDRTGPRPIDPKMFEVENDSDDEWWGDEANDLESDVGAAGGNVGDSNDRMGKEPDAPRSPSADREG